MPGSRRRARNRVSGRGAAQGRGAAESADGPAAAAVAQGAVPKDSPGDAPATPLSQQVAGQRPQVRAQKALG